MEKIRQFIDQLNELMEPSDEELQDAIYDRITWSGETEYNTKHEI